MPEIYYAAVEDDPLTSGKGSRVNFASSCGTVRGDDGKFRRLAFIGDKAYCAACDSLGLITYGAALNERRRMLDLANGGRHQAVGDDIVLCRCSPRPRIIAVYGRKWMIFDRGDTQKVTGSATHARISDHWISFMLTELGSFEGVRCIAHFIDGSQATGIFDAQNKVRFERIDNSSACARIELLMAGSGSALESVTGSILSAIER